MRDLVIFAAIAWVTLSGVKRPWIGILGWTWIGFMNPHTLSWRLTDMPVAAAVAAATLIGVAITKDRKEFFVTRETVVLMLFMFWTCVTLPFSFYFDDSLEMWRRVMKIDFMVLVAMVVLHSRKHIIALAAVVAGSIGYYGIKGGVFTLLTGGVDRVWGPAGSFIEGNNELALALIMIIPLFRFLQLQVEWRWGKHALTGLMILCAAASLGSHSRGALLAFFAMGLVLWSRSRRKVVSAIVLVALGAALIAFMPENWVVRMETINTYEQDGSAMGRINAWWMAWNLAKENFFGGGFAIYKPSLFALYAPDPTDIHAAHSIYFQVLGEHGYIGLLLFLLLFWLVWLSAGHLRRAGQKLPETRWLSDLGAMCQVSLAGYAVGGTFLSLAYFDLPYNILILVVLGRRWLEKKEWLNEPRPTPTPTPGAALVGGRLAK